MPGWTNFKHHLEVQDAILAIVKEVRQERLDLGRPHYACALAAGVWQAILCGNDRLAAVEMGVAAGAGLLDLCKAAGYFAREFELDIRVYGFDRGIGLPPPLDYRDHPEIWRGAQYPMGDPDALRAKLPDFGKLILGDIADTARAFRSELADRKLAFVSIDVDYYSSTMDCLQLLTFEPDCYMPAVPMYFDDVDIFLTFNDFCGEEAAIRDFNAAEPHRKIVRRDKDFRIRRFFVCNVLDHPLRTGERECRQGFPQRVRAF